MSAIEYNNLLFETSQKLDELNVLDRLVFMCRGKLASGSEDTIRNVLSLFKELEEQNNLGIDRLEEMKELLKGVGEWSLNGKVERFESKRREYNVLLEQTIRALDELDDLERLMEMCKGKISEGSEGRIQDVRSLFKELENQNNLGAHRLDLLKGILTELEKTDLVREVEEFEERRKQEDDLKKKEDNIQRRKAQAAAFVSSVRNKLTGVLNIKTVFKVVAGGITVVSTMEVLSRWSTFDQLVTAVNSCVLPAGTSLVQLTDGCVCLTVRAETLSALATLWKLYQDGTLETRLYEFFVTDEVRERAGGEEVEVNVTIEEQEYEKACRELNDEAQDVASSSDRERIRRNSDSAVQRPKEEPALFKLQHAETELKFHKDRIAVIKREIEELSAPEILEACTPEEKAAFLKQHEKWKAREAGDMEERADDPDTSRLSKAKLMDPGKYAFVQKYLEDVQETRSMITEASDSGLVTHTAASELGTEEISETNKLSLKDLSRDVTQELIRRLKADEAAMEKFYSFFGLKMPDQYPITEIMGELFPDTTVSVLKECFEELQLYDLADLLEKVRPRSLRPALSPEQIEKLQGIDDRPEKCHSNVAVLILDNNVKEEIVVRDNAEKIKSFFKVLNSRNEVAIISPITQESRVNFLRLGRIKQQEEVLKQEENRIRRQLEIHLPEERNHLEMQMGKEGKGKQTMPRMRYQGKNLGQILREIKQEELELKRELEFYTARVAEVKEQIDMNFQQVQELKKETKKAVSTAVDKWINHQEKFTHVVVIVISDQMMFKSYTKEVLDECVVAKLALIPDHAKLVVSPFWWKGIGKVPETLHVMYPGDTRHTSIFSWMTEIFSKRWQTLDLLSMMRELKRTCHGKSNTDRQPAHQYRYSGFKTELWDITIRDNMSTRLRFQKTEENSPLKATSDSATEI